MNLIEGLEMLNTTIEQDLRDSLYMQYCNAVIWMDKDNYLSFDQYFNRQTGNRYATTVQSKQNNKKATIKKGHDIANDIIKKLTD